jgi:Malectin domain
MSIPNSFSRHVGSLFIVALVAVFCLAPFGHAADEGESSHDRPTVRIKAGSTKKYTDHAGNVWMPDKGFKGGETIARPDDMKIENTKDPDIYRSERYSMESFAQKLPNGKYTVKLHFAETYEGVSGEGERVFSFDVEGKEFKDFDVFKKAGGVQKAYIEKVPVDITDGVLDITFTPNIQNPEINGIEIIPVEEKEE